MMFRILAFCAVLAACLAPIAALACDSDRHPFDPSNADKRHFATVRSGTLVLKPHKNRDAFIAETTSVTATTGKDTEICVTMTFEHVGQADKDTAGVAFWSVDADNYYYFGMTPDGRGYIEQRVNSITNVLVDFRPVLGANIGQGASNRIEITTIGKHAVIHVNDKEFDRIVGEPPSNIQMMLLAVAGGPKAPVTTFDDLTAQATTVLAVSDDDPSSQAKAGGCDGVAYVDDPFDHWDERWWGKLSSSASIADGHLLVTASPGQLFQLSTDLPAGDLDICSTALISSAEGQAGLEFWRNGDGDRDALLVGRDGKLRVQRSAGVQLTDVLAPVSIETDPAGNRLKVSIRGGHAEIYANGKDLGGVTAPPEAGGEAGLIVENEGRMPVKASFDDLVIAKPPAPDIKAGAD